MECVYSLISDSIRLKLFVCVCVCMQDVVTDILIAIQFYNNGEMAFFGICISIFIIASLCYTTLFIYLYCDHAAWHDNKYVCVYKKTMTE